MKATLAETVTHLDEADIVALTVWAEARGEGLAGMVAVAGVIANRVADPQHRYGRDWRRVCLRKWQFSCWWVYDDNYAALAALAARVAAVETIVDARYVEARAIAGGVISAGSARHYLTAALWQAAPPIWAAGRTPAARLGRHLFLEGIDV